MVREFDTRKLSRAILLFFVLDLSVLAINFWIAGEVAQDAVSINLAGRQRMLTQRITKALLQLQQPATGVSRSPIEKELRDAVRLFDQTLSAFERGGVVTGGDGRMVGLRRVDTGQAAMLVSQALSVWEPVRRNILPLAESEAAIPVDVIESASRQMLQSNQQLLDLMNQLASGLERDSMARANILRIVQAAVFSLALLIFVVIVLGFRAQARHAVAMGKHYAALATRDTLTGLFNRREFNDALEREFASARRRKGSMALLLLDLDGFKQVNDTHGHAAGDKVLCAVSSRISEVARANDTVARIGGDEFVLICPDMSDEESAATLSQRLIEAINLPIDIGAAHVRIGVSIGIAFCTEQVTWAEEMIRQADQAMYTAKKSGRNRYHFAAGA